MLSFKTYIYESLLLENRIEFLKQQNPTIDTSHDSLAKHKDAGAIIDHFANKADPTPNKAHTQWLVNQYKKKGIRQEDAPQIKRTLNDFDKVKDRLEKKDINQYEHLGELRDAISTQKSQTEKKIKEKESAKSAKSADMEKLYDHDGVVGFKIPNKEVSVKNYGIDGKLAQTHWCTAANSGQNMFNHYKGGKYTMHFPNNEVLQFHHQSDQIMDKNDHPVQEGDPRFKDYEHHISKFLHQTKQSEGGSKINRFVHFEPHEIDGAIKSYKDTLEARRGEVDRMGYTDAHKELSNVASKAKLSDKQFDEINKLPVGKNYFGKPEGAALELSNNKNISHEQVGRLINDQDDVVRTHHHEQLASNPAVKGEHIDSLLKSPHTEQVRHLIALNPNLEQHHADQLLSDSPGTSINHTSTRSNLAKNVHVTLTPDHQRILRQDESNRRRLADRHDLHSDTVEHIIEHGGHPTDHIQLIENPHVKLDDDHLKKIYARAPGKLTSRIPGKIFESPKTSPEVREHVFNKQLEHVDADDIGKSEDWHYSTNPFTEMAKSKYFTKDHVNKLLDAADKHAGTDNEVSLRNGVAHSLKASPEQLDRQIDKITVSSSAFGTLLNNKNLKPSHLKKMYDHIADEDYMSTKITDHPSANSDVLHHVMDKGNNWERTRVLHHPNVQSSHFQKAMDAGQSMHGAISSSPSAPPSALHKLADSPFSFVRQNVASHKNTPNETLTKLANDSDENVAEAARKRIKVK